MRWILPVGAASAVAALALWLLSSPPGDGGSRDDVAARAEPSDESGTEAPAETRVVLTGRGTGEGGLPTAPDRVRIVTGVVVLPDGLPVEGASVVLTEGAPGSEEPSLRATTGEDGRFQLGVALPGAGDRRTTIAVEWGPYGAVRQVTVPGLGDEAAGTLDPLDLGPLRIEVRNDVVVFVEGARGARKAVVHAVPLDGDLEPLPMMHAPCDGSGRAELRGLASGTWHFVATAESAGRATTTLSLPRRVNQPLRLEIGEERVLEVLVRDAATGQPIPGATVRAEPAGRGRPPLRSMPLLAWSVPETTGPEGTLRIRGLAAGDEVRVRAEAPGHPPPTGAPTWTTVGPGRETVVLRLDAARAVRWRILRTGDSVPPDGSRVRISGTEKTGEHAPPQEGDVLGGAVVATGWAPGAQHAVAVAPDGSLALLPVPDRGEDGPPIEFRRPMRIHARLLSEAGSPLVDWRVGLTASGPVRSSGLARTDETGRAVLGGILPVRGEMAHVFVEPPEDRLGGGRPLPLRRVDLSGGDVRFDAVIPDLRDVLVEVRLDGAKRLPPPTVATTILLNGEPVDGAVRDEEAATLRLRWRPAPTDTRLDVNLRAEGLVPGSDRVSFAPGRPGEVLTLRVDLEAPGGVEVRVRLPHDGLHGIVLDRQPRADAPWRPAEASHLLGASTAARAADRGVVVFARVAPGRYRARDAESGVTSEPILVSGGETARGDLDLQRAGWVEGQVVGGAGDAAVELLAADPRAGRVDASAPPQVVARVVPSPDGTFRLRVPGTARYRVRATSPTRLYEPREGWEVQKPTRGLTFRTR